jgi:two-component system, OmpR family, sensor histidine kinase KdpD
MTPVKSMKRNVDWREILRWIAGLMSVALTALLLALAGANATAAGMIFLMLVVAAAAVAEKWLSLLIAVVCAVSFDYFFLPPVHSFRIAGYQEWVAMITFLASCMVVSRVAERARRQTRHAEQRREDVERLYELSQEMMLHEDAAGLVRDLPHLVDRVFSLDGVMLYVSDQDQFYASGAGLPASVQSALRAVAQGPGPSLPAPEGFSAIALTLGMRAVGALGWRPEARLSREVATAVGAQVAIALTHSIAIAASARIEASRQGERLRTALIDSLTHELRTPLTAIRAAATTLLQGEGLDEAGRQDLAALVDEEASRLDSLIGEAVEMAEIDAQVVRVHLVQQHPRALLEHAIEESREVLAGHRVVIAVEGPDDPAWFDPHLLSRVFRHLLENAARYTPPESRITLRSRRTGERLEFSVEDNGPGIDSLDMPLIFEKFYRGKKGAAIGKGTGMGLAITRAIMAAHSGGIEAKSVPGQGTSFTFWVPLVEKEPANEFSELQRREARGSVEKFQSVMSKVSDAPPEEMDRI